jgi:tRNA dimethylallyltransferase
MLPEPFQNRLILTGPTGSGKSTLSLELAERLKAEIISMDSMALYRGMDIGTAKPDATARRRVPHHLLDVLDPWESASVAWWLKEAAACVRAIELRGKQALFVGGTPMYLKALLRGLFDGPAADEAVRQRLFQEAEVQGGEALHRRLARVDPVTAARLHVHDLRRVIRALEVWELTGTPISHWQQQWRRQPTPVSALPAATADSRPVLAPGEKPHTFPVLVLDLPRTQLYARIDGRVKEMMDAGLLDEVRALRQLPRPLSREAAQALGYKELFEYLEGRCPLDEAVTRIQTRSRQFAKRQLSWFRHLPECRLVTRELTFAVWGLTMDD